MIFKLPQVFFSRFNKINFRQRLLLIVIAGVVLFSFALFDYLSAMNTPLIITGETVKYEVSAGSNLTKIVYDLKKQGYINKPRYLLFYARFQGSADKISTGEYLIKPGVSAREFLKQVLTGKVIQYAITIVEGWNIYQVLEVINNHPHIIHSLHGLSHEQIMAKIGYPNMHPEGRFYPDTYHFPKGLTDVHFLQRAYTAMQNKLATEWQKRDVGLPYKSPYEALTMASIVEKETGQANERRAIAGVFIRRLDKRMRLQTDPTVIYGLGPKFDGNIRRRDLKKDTPYNTYRRHGLPPTPIAMPGGEAIHAAMHPAEGHTLYFVSKGDGSHYFSTTLDEHNQAVIKYQLKGRKRNFSSFNAKTGKTKE